MKFIDICAGIGGFRLGFELAGHKCIGFIERDKFAVASYRAMYDTEGEFYYDDVTTIKSSNIPYTDAWCFGFPCQDISVAGKQAGLDGARSGLYFKIIDLVKGKKEDDKPQWLIIENVKNLLSIDSGWGFTRVLGELDEAGYDAEWQVFNSKDFGVPQNRERVFIVGHLRTRGRREVFPISGTDGKDYVETIDYARESKIKDRTRIFSVNGISPCLRATDYKDPAKIIQVGNISKLNGSGGDPQSGRVYSVDGISPCLDTCGGGRREVKIVIPVLTPDRAEKRQNGRRFKENGEPMFTLTAQDRQGVFDGFRIRKLTPKECFRLQGFPDEYFERAQAVNSNSQLYKQAGNGVTVTVTRAIGDKLMEVSNE